MSTNRDPSILDVLAGSVAGPDVLADGVRFHSPAHDYAGRADVWHLLTLIARVLGTPRATASGRLGDVAVTSFTATVRARDTPTVDGLLVETRDGTGRITRAWLYLRPYAALRRAIGEMGRLLEDEPLPGSGGRSAGGSPG